MKQSIEFPVEGEDGAERIYEIQFDYHPGTPGKTWGDPDDCYPPEPAEVEILGATLDGKTVTDVDLEALVKAHGEHIERVALEQASEPPDYQERDDHDAKFDSMRDSERGNP